MQTCLINIPLTKTTITFNKQLFDHASIKEEEILATVTASRVKAVQF